MYQRLLMPETTSSSLDLFLKCVKDYFTSNNVEAFQKTIQMPF